MQDVAKQDNGQMRIYFCGGAGINIGASYLANTPVAGIADIHPVYCDTSMSNIRTQGIIGDQVMLLEGADGSGKIRRENHQAITDVINPLLIKHPPMRLNLVVFSAGGGSGSVFGPLITQALLKRDESVIALVVGSEESLITARNTIKTLRSLDNMAGTIEQPIIMYYAHNRLGAHKSETDDAVRGAIAALSVLACPLNDAIDSKDISNFLNYNRVTDVAPQLSALEIVSDPKEMPTINGEAKVPVSLVSLYRTADSLPLSVVPDYIAEGYMSSPSLSDSDLHFVITCDDVLAMARAIEARIGDIEERSSARSRNTRISTKNDQAEDNGLIL